MIFQTIGTKSVSVCVQIIRRFRYQVTFNMGRPSLVNNKYVVQNDSSYKTALVSCLQDTLYNPLIFTQIYYEN